MSGLSRELDEGRWCETKLLQVFPKFGYVINQDEMDRV